jgi:hypothetical protein
MIKHSLLLFFIVLTSASTKVFSQSKTLDLSNRIDARYGIQKMFDAKELAKRNASSYPDVQGSPYWSEKWLKAFVQLTNGTVYTVAKAKIDTHTQEFEYLNENEMRLVIDATSILKVACMKEEDTSAYEAVFIVLPDHIDNKSSAFFRICNNGKVQLLAMQKNAIKSGPPDPFVTTQTSFFNKKTYYVLYNDNHIIPLKSLDLDAIISSLKPNTEILDWLRKSKNKLKNEEDVVKFLDEYNKQ